VSIWDSYDVDDGVEVSGESSAGFSGGLSMDDSRRISGPGDVYAVQGYSGSGGYAGANYIYSRDASQTLVRGTARLTPDTLGAIQDVSIKDADLSAVVSTGDRGGRGAMQHAFVLDGSLDSIQTIDIDGGIATSQDTQMTGFLPTAFGTAGYMNADLGPGTLNLEGEGAAVAVSSLDLAGPAEVDCRLATGTGNSAWAFGDVRSASSDLGAVGAGAGAGKVNLEVDLTGGLPGLYIGGEGEVAGTGVAAAGKKNEISGTLAAGTGFSGTGAFAEDVKASNKDGIAVAAAAAGGLGGVLDIKNLAVVGGAEAAGVGVAAAGEKNEIRSGTLAARTGFSGTGAFAEDVEASNKDGIAVAAAAAGGLGGVLDLKNLAVVGGAEAAGVGVAASGEKNEIRSGTLAAGTGFSGTDAFAEDVEASNKDGIAVAAAAAGGLGGVLDLKNLAVVGGAEAAGVGVAASGEKNEIRSGTLAARTGFSGTGAFAEDVEASNKNGIAVAAAAAGGLGGVLDLKNLAAVGGAEGAIFGAGAAGQKNHVGVGSVEASTGNGAEVVARDVDASSREGAAGTGVAAGNVQVALAGATTITGEGSAVGAGAVGFKAYAGADRLRAKSGDSTSAAGKGLTTSIVDGVAGAGAIGATYDSKGPGSGWEVASVEGDITGIGEISGDFRANTDQSATARANNVFAEGNDVHLGSHADDGTSSSDADTTFSGYFSDGKLKAYAGDSTLALQKGRISGLFEMEAEADSFDPPEHKSRYKGWFFGDYDIDVKAWTDETGAHAKAKKEKV